MIDHTPYRGWCPFCVAGAGKSEWHRAIESESEHNLPTIAVDYAFMGEKEEEDELTSKCTPYLIARDQSTQWTDAHVVPSKGTKHSYPFKAMAEDVVAAVVKN